MSVTPRDRRRESTRADILRTAWRLAERDGVAALSLREVAREVGMQAPSLYTYFPSKAAIYDAMFAEGYRALGATMGAVPMDPADPVGSLTGAGTSFVAFCQESVARYQLLFSRAVPDWEPTPEIYAVSVEQLGHTLERLAVLGITDPREVDLLLALFSGLAAQQVANEPGGDRWRRLTREAAEMFLSHTQRRNR